MRKGEKVAERQRQAGLPSTRRMAGGHTVAPGGGEHRDCRRRTSCAMRMAAKIACVQMRPARDKQREMWRQTGRENEGETGESWSGDRGKLTTENKAPALKQSREQFIKCTPLCHCHTLFLFFVFALLVLLERLEETC